jgi:hypothetical protein
MSDDVIEYLFFTRAIADEFAKVLQQHKLDYQEQNESLQAAIVFQLDENIDQVLWTELDELYDELSIQDQMLLEEGTTDLSARSTAGIYLQLMDGRQTVAQVDPDTVNRILSVLNMDEFNAFLETIVRSVEQPDDSPVCQQLNI